MASEMIDADLFEILCCPACRGELEGRAPESELYCAACQFHYPVVEGIPVLFPMDVKAHFDELFGRFWDSEDRASTYDLFVEGEQSMMDMHHHRGEIRATLEKYPNLWADLAFRDELYRIDEIDPEWRQLLVDYPDRFLLGTDTYTPDRWYLVVENADEARHWLNLLPQSIANNIAYGNAERLLKKVGWQ